MTTEVVSPISMIARRFRQIAGGKSPTGAPAAGSEHELVALSHHRTSDGVITYARCDCGDLQIWLTGAGRPAHELVKASHRPERPPA
jgi:hypothetical protein